MKKLILLLLLLAPAAQAAVFDSADFLGPQTAALSAQGELLLNDPTSEGVEGRGRFGLSDDLNLNATIGTGTKSKKFRLGGEAVFNFIPDGPGQFGFSGLGSATYQRREIDGNSSGGIIFRVGPLVSKKIEGMNGTPTNIYAALPISFDARGGKYTTGTQLVAGSIFDLNSSSRYYAGFEGGVSLSKSESYILAGIGMRLGELKFEKKEKRKGGGSHTDDGDEYRDEDFKK